MRHMLDDPIPDERRHAIARILAKGVLRLRRNAMIESSSPAKPELPESGEKRLDVLATSRPHATTG